MVTNKQSLRFAALPRVSTEQQAKKGESLPVQRATIIRDVKSLGGEIVCWYGGQEHATPGYEKKEINRLLHDAAKKSRPFDAVVVAHADRWSRDNEQSTKGLSVLREHGVRFFVGTSEYDLHNPDDELFLSLSAVIGQYYARNQKRKSNATRRARAKSGRAAVGKRPFGRTFNKETGRWGVDEEKAVMIQDIAKRYLAGESLGKLAKEYGLNHPNLNKTLHHRCGPVWEQAFLSDDKKTTEVFKTPIPRLLDDKTIAAIKKKASANKTYRHGEIKYRYLLSRMIFCEHCGLALTGQTNHSKARYYRHRSRHHCNDAHSWIVADEMEDIVLRYLFEAFGNPQRLQKAIEAATPDLAKMEEYRQRIDRLTTEMDKIQKGRDQLLRLIGKGSLTDEQAEKQLMELTERENACQSSIDRLNEAVANSPDGKQIQAATKAVAAGLRKKYSIAENTRFRRMSATANKDFASMTYEEKRALCEGVFSGKTVDGKRMGVYISWDGKDWTFAIRGHLIDMDDLTLMAPDVKEAFFLEEGGYLGLHGYRAVTKSACHCTAEDLRECRSRPDTSPPVGLCL